MRTEQKASPGKMESATNIKKAMSCSWQILGLTYLSILAGCHTSSQCVESEIPVDKEYVNTVGMKMVRIGPGSFMMGQQQGGDWDERPVHKVNITQPFYVAVTEVTNAQYELFDPDHRRLRGRWGLSNADDEAVVFVSWNDAIAFCKWLSKKEGRPYRLPTEAEWEYVCRAGTSSSYYTGDELPEVYHKNQKEAGQPEQVDLTVGSTPPNPWGLYDMHGNVEEWCLGWYRPYFEGEQFDPLGWVDGDFKVTRGGSHNTKAHFLRSANRQGAMPNDKHWLIGFRVVMGEMPTGEPMLAVRPPLWARKVSQKKYNWSDGPNPNKPYFSGPKPYVKVPPNSNGPMFSRHNHDPALTWCGNGDMFAIWYSCNRERGRELCVLASRLRRGAEQWEPAAPFWDAPDRNDHAPALLNDGQGTLYHFNGLSAGASYRKNLALIMRTSKDNGSTWSKARLINPVRGMSNQPVASAFRTKEGYLVVPSDWPWHPDGRGTALWISRDKGRTWQTPPGRIAGIHAAVTQLAPEGLDDGRLIALGRDSNINGRMPKSISADMGRTWTYQASHFPPIGGGQRSVLLHLKEGPLFFASFGKDMPMTDAAGRYGKVSGLFGAISFDEGKHWPIRKLITPGGLTRKGRAMDAREFTMSPTSAEPRGYMTGVQSPDGVIHLISSWNHYAFNLTWLKTPPDAEPVTRQQGAPSDQTGLMQTDVFFAGELGYKEFRIPALVVTKNSTLLAISEAGRTTSDFGDRGTTWKPGGLISEVGLNTNEASVYEAVDGTLWMNIRGGDGLPGPRTQPYRLIATSSDGGLSWSRAQYDSNLIGPRCLASTVRYSWPEQGRSRVLFANPADEKQRAKMTVHLSYDDGKTWPLAKQIFAGPTAYSCLARLPNGDIGLLYERGDRHRYEKMTFARFTLTWLTNGKDKLPSN